MHNTEDKKHWVKEYGEGHEKKFIEVASLLGIKGLKLNPEKQDDPTVIDYVWGEYLADLKTQKTPFFTASRYNLETRYAVTFNKIDYERYIEYEKSTGKNIYIFYWLDWVQTEWKDESTEYLFGVFFDSFLNIRQRIQQNGAPEHSYIRRTNDNSGNAKSSYILDIRRFRTIIQIPTKLYVPDIFLP